MLQALEEQVGAARFSAAPLLEWLGSTDWLDLPGVSEWPFEWRVGGVSLVGAVDRLSEKDGRLWVLDYKVFSALKEDRLARELYGPQLELYSGAVAQVAELPISAALIQISPEGVRLTEVPLSTASSAERAESLALRARELLADPASGEARPNRQDSCRLCPHLESCH
jgi:RecB family exonuclease